ncbi:DnaJ family molecular chaperone [Rhizobium sp. KVB221]|uniref:DnaJ family molecular chaperone n=1 Tax=Rhizobium setariae TaxID=2801340 RepID=A0A936YVV6_9HYPH|nr:DnaJ family molecular chaperone [Rhizobium setariae]MBL0374487.1 DnaJ family molecular chaperone [Rhizobium setariae]
MSFWEKLLSSVADTATNALNSLVEAIRTVFEGDPETRRKVAFSVAVIALSAKMAKADGVVTENEVKAFQQVFHYPEEEARNVARLYNMAKQDVAGYEAYAEKLSGLCSSGDANCPLLENILDGLFHIAKADGAVHEKEIAFLENVAAVFRISEEHFERITARHVYVEGRDPYIVLGVSRKDDFHTIKQRYRSLVKEHHPDRLIARGMPSSFHAIAHDRMAKFNAAYSAIERELRAA